MKRKKLVALILCLAMAVSMLTGCGKKEDPAAGQGDAQTATAKDNEKKDDASVDTLPPVTLKWYLHGSNVTDDKVVLEKVNAYLKDKINVTLEPIWGTWGDFDENVTLAINGGDDVDIYFTCS